MSAYYARDPLLALRIQRNKATSLHSSAVHLEGHCHLAHLEILPNSRIGLGGSGVGPNTCISTKFPDDVGTTSPHSCGKVLDEDTASQSGLHTGLTWKVLLTTDAQVSPPEFLI